MTTDTDALTPEERSTWDVDPDLWPHTPPLHVFRALMDEDDNLWWRAGSGHGLNLYEAAVDLLDERDRMLATIARVEALAKRWDTGLWPTDDGGTIHSRHQSHGNGPQGDEQVGLALGDTRGADRPSDRRIR